MGLNIPPSDQNIQLSDIVTANATIARHGFLKKLSNVVTEYMDGSGNFSTPAGGTPTSGSAYTIIGGSASGVTNGTNLLAAYVTAQAATPQGAALATGNRYTIFLLPGVYDLGAGTLALATDFIDIVGLSENTGARIATDATNFGDTLIKSSGNVISVTSVSANTDITIANLALQCTNNANFALHSTVDFLPSWKAINVYVRGNAADQDMSWSGRNYGGYWADVRAWRSSAFGGAFGGGGNATGNFVRCKASGFSFGQTASGIFIDCESDGTSLGPTAASGTFIRCREVVVSGTAGGILAGAFTGVAEDCFTSGSALSYTSGTVRNCNFSGTVENRGIIFKKNTARLGGSIRVDTTATGNVDAGEDNLITYSVPAATLATNGDYLEFDCFGTFAANANTKQLKIFFGATAIFASTALIFNGLDWRGHGKIIRTGAATQKCIAEFTIGGVLLGALTTTITTYATAAETLSGAVIFKCTGEDSGGVPVTDSVVQQGLVLKWFPVGN